MAQSEILIMSQQDTGSQKSIHIAASSQQGHHTGFTPGSYYKFPIDNMSTFLIFASCSQDLHIKSLMDVDKQSQTHRPFTKVIEIIYEVDNDQDNNMQLETLLYKLTKISFNYYAFVPEGESPSKPCISYLDYKNIIIYKCFSSRHGWALLRLDQLKDKTLGMIQEWLNAQLYSAVRLENSKHFLIKGQIQKDIVSHYCSQIIDLQLEAYHNWHYFLKLYTQLSSLHVGEVEKCQNKIKILVDQIDPFAIMCEEFHIYFNLKFKEIKNAAELVKFYYEKGWNSCIKFDSPFNKNNVIRSRLPPIDDFIRYCKKKIIDQNTRLNINFSYHSSQNNFTERKNKPILEIFLDLLTQGYSDELNLLKEVLLKELNERLQSYDKQQNFDNNLIIKQCIIKLYYNFPSSNKLFGNQSALKASCISLLLGEEITSILALLARKVFRNISSIDQTKQYYKHLGAPSINNIIEELYQKLQIDPSFLTNHHLKINLQDFQNTLLHSPKNLAETQATLGKIKQPFHLLTDNQERKDLNKPPKTPHQLLDSTFEKNHILFMFTKNTVPVCILPPPSSSRLKQYSEQIKSFICLLLNSGSLGIILMDNLFEYGFIKLKGYKVTEQQRQPLNNQLIQIFRQINPCPVYFFQGDTFSRRINLKIDYIKMMQNSHQNGEVVLRITVQPSQASQKVTFSPISNIIQPRQAKQRFKYKNQRQRAPQIQELGCLSNLKEIQSELLRNQ